MKYIQFVILLVCFSGCMPVMKTLYGIKQPRLESEKTIKEFLRKKHIDTSDVYFFKDYKSIQIASRLNMLAIPDAMFFNNEGNFVPYKETTKTCNADADKFISDMNAFYKAPSDPTNKIDMVFDLISGNATRPKNAEINVFITWTVYAGRLNDQKAFEWVKLLEKAKSQGVDVKYYLLNCDFQKQWNLTPSQIKGLGIKI